MLHVNIPIPNSSKDVITKFLVSWIFFSEKLFPIRRWIPVWIPIPAITAIIVAKVIRVELVPIISLVVTFDTTSQKM